ncbi:hypothetical protein E8E11_006427 [Didymella keratinophila]|nr:hypothetical protein E8E11_006427 [Didymella keratinophila]
MDDSSPVATVEEKGEPMEIDNMDIRSIFDRSLEATNLVEAYNKERDELVKREEEDSWDRDVRPRGSLRSKSKFQAIEQRAATIVHAIREYERRVTFGNLPSEAIPGPETLDMGGQFLTNKKRIDTLSKLFEIAEIVPKGALLHLHFNAELNPEQLLEQAKDMKNIYIRSIRPLLHDSDLNETEMVFNVLDPTTVNTDVDIFSPDYPGTATNWREKEMQAKIWMRWQLFQDKFIENVATDKFPKRYGQHLDSEHVSADKPVRVCCPENSGPVELNAAENWLKSKMVLSPTEAYGESQTVNGVWARFNQATRCFKGLLNYEQVYKWYIGKAIDKMIEEKVMYAELRPMLLDKFIPTNDGKGKITNWEQMQMVIDGYMAKQEELKAKGELDKFPFGLKIVYCTPRSIPKKMMQEEMKQCIELKERFPHLICGFDLVGAEDRPNHIGFYKEELVAFKATCKAKNLDIPFLFHAGESLLDTGGSGDPSKSNLYDAVALGAERIGHGFALMKHPHLVDKFRRKPGQKGICVELCPISNELLHLCRNIKEHPFPELLAAGIPCTVNSDNPSLFTNSMNHEFYQIMVGAPTMSLYSWKQLARWSIEYSCLSKNDKKKGLEILNEAWQEFCQIIVDVCDDKDTGMMNGDDVDNTKTGTEDKSDTRVEAFFKRKVEWKKTETS